PAEQTTLANQIVGLVKDNQAQMRELMDPGKQIQVLTSLLGLLPKPVEAKPDTTLDKLINFLMEDRKALREEISDLRKLATATKEKPLLAQLEELEPVLERL